MTLQLGFMFHKYRTIDRQLALFWRHLCGACNRCVAASNLDHLVHYNRPETAAHTCVCTLRPYMGGNSLDSRCFAWFWLRVLFPHIFVEFEFGNMGEQTWPRYPSVAFASRSPIPGGTTPSAGRPVLAESPPSHSHHAAWVQSEILYFDCCSHDRDWFVRT